MAINWWGTDPRIEQVSTYNPETTKQIQQTGQFGMEQLRNPYKGFAPQEALARRQFETRTIPSIAERYAQTLQGNERLGSSGFADIMSQAGNEFQLGLESLRSQYGLQNQQNALRALQLGQTPTFENQQIAGQQGIIPGILNSAAAAIPHALAGFATGGGSLIGTAASSLMDWLRNRGGGGETAMGTTLGGSPAQQQYGQQQRQAFQGMPFNQQLQGASFPTSNLQPIVNPVSNPGALHPSLQGQPGLPSQLTRQGLFSQFGQQQSLLPAALYAGKGQLF